MAFSTFATATTISSTAMNANFTDAQNQLDAKLSSFELSNLTLTYTTNTPTAGDMTIAVKDRNGSDPSASSPVRVGMRARTGLPAGTFNTISITSALSLVISSGSTLGQTSTKPWVQWIYLIDNAGTLELAISGSLYNENQFISTTAEGGAGAADSVTTVYSTTTRSSVPFRLIGKLLNTQTTAGTWANSATQLQVGNYGSLTDGGYPTVQILTFGSGTYYTPAGCIRLKIKMVGGGGSGGGGGTDATVTNGNTGNTSTFGTSLLTATGGGGGVSGVSTGGSVTVNSPAINIGSFVGQSGSGINAGNTQYTTGGFGGGSIFGGGGCGNANAAGSQGISNSGSGGAGGGTTNAAGDHRGQGGGAAGGGINAVINNPLSAYAYTAASAVTGGAAGTDGYAGGSGASATIVVEEFYS